MACDKCGGRGYIMITTQEMYPDGTGSGSSSNAPCPNGCKYPTLNAKAL